MPWTPFAKLTNYTSGRRVGTQPGQADINAEFDNVIAGVNAAGQAVDTHAADATAHTGTFYTKAQVDALAGTGRTTETIKGAYDALTAHFSDGSAHVALFYTKTQLDGGQLDTRYPTRSDLASAIADAALGTLSSGVVTNRGDLLPQWTLQGGGVDTFRWKLNGGNLDLDRWTGTDWVLVGRFYLNGDPAYLPIAASYIAYNGAPGISATNVEGALDELADEKLSLAGGTMTGLLTLAGAPTDSLHAATKQYADDLVSALQVRSLYAADSTVNSAAGTSETTIKSLTVAKCSSAGLNISSLSVVGSLKVSAGTGSLKIYVDGVLGATLTTTSTSYALVKSPILGVSWTDDTLHTIEFKVSNSGANTTYNEILEVYVA